MKLVYFFVFLTLATFLVAGAASAEEVMRAMSVKGSPTIKCSGKSETRLKPGDKIESDCKVTIPSGSKVSVMTSSGATAELGSGSYSFSSIKAKVAKAKSSTLNKFAGYVMDELESEDAPPGSFNKNMNETASTYRAAGGKVNVMAAVATQAGLDADLVEGLSYANNFLFAGDNELLEVKLPRNSYLLAEMQDFRWYSFKDSPNYTFRIKNRADSVVYEIKTNDTTVAVDLAGFARGENYYWSISTEEDKSSEYCFRILTEAEQSMVENDLAEVEIIYGPDSNVGRLIAASYCADKNIQPYAYEAYVAAAESDPENEQFAKLCANYLSRLGLAAEVDKFVK